MKPMQNDDAKLPEVYQDEVAAVSREPNLLTNVFLQVVILKKDRAKQDK